MGKWCKVHFSTRLSAKRSFAVRGFSFHFRRIVHPVTIRKALQSHILNSTRPYKGLQLTQCCHAGRLNWARAHVWWTRRQWGSVLFSDESKFNVSFADCRLRV